MDMAGEGSGVDVATGGAPFDEKFRGEGGESEKAQEGSASESGSAIILVVKDFNMEWQGVGFASDVS